MTVHGEIEAISLLPCDTQYNVKISLIEGLITSYNKDLPFRQEMRGTGEIITQNRRLIEKLFNQIREILEVKSDLVFRILSLPFNRAEMTFFAR